MSEKGDINSMDGMLKIDNNKIIRRIILKAFPSGFVGSLSITINMLMTSMLCGFFFSPAHIAATGVVMPLIMLPSAFLDVFSSGASVLLAMYLGRNDKEKCNRVFSLSLVLCIGLAVLFVLIMEFFAGPLLRLYGAKTTELSALSIQYLRMFAPSMIPLQAIMLLNCTHSSFGNHSVIMKGTIMKLVLSFVISILLIKFTNMGIASLGLGAVLSPFPTIIYQIAKFKTKKVPIKFSMKNAKLSDVADMVKHGFSSSTDRIIDSFIGGLVNNLVVTWLGVAGMAIFSVVKSITNLARTAYMSIKMGSSCLTGILYGARDKNGIKRTFEETLKLGLLFSVAWFGLIILLIPFLISIFMRNSAGLVNPEQIIRSGVYIILAFFPITALVGIASSFYEITERYGYALASSILPDSLIYPILLLILLPSLGYTGLWVSYGGFCLVFLVFFLLFLMFKYKKVKLSMDEILCLNKSIRDNVPMLDISIMTGNMNVGGISEQMSNFLIEHGAAKRTAYMCSLCTEEIIADYIAHASEISEKDREFIDIKLFSDEDTFKLVIRNSAKRYNPLDFEFDPNTMKKIGVVMAQKLAKKIEYSSAFNINIINIDIAK